MLFHCCSMKLWVFCTFSFLFICSFRDTLKRIIFQWWRYNSVFSQISNFFNRKFKFVSIFFFNISTISLISKVRSIQQWWESLEISFCDEKFESEVSVSSTILIKLWKTAGFLVLRKILRLIAFIQLVKRKRRRNTRRCMRGDSN